MDHRLELAMNFLSRLSFFFFFFFEKAENKFQMAKLVGDLNATDLPRIIVTSEETCHGLHRSSTGE